LQKMERLFLLCSGLLVTTVTSQHNVCSRPQLSGNIEMSGIQRFSSPGEELALACKEGYTPLSGPRKIVCTINGVWTSTKLKCIPKQCPHPELITNGELFYEDTVYQSAINYTCHEGYMMTGESSAVCQANGTWGSPAPECIPIPCGLAPVPLYGMVIYDKVIRGNTVNYGLKATYICNPPYALFGNPVAECTASGTWTKTPECQVVTCPPPESIERGYMSNNEKREFFYRERVKYGCESPYVLEGNVEVVCQENGKWSEKPSCKAPCSVNLQRARILHNGKKIWIENFQPNRVLHLEIVSVYCMNEARKCGYAVPTQCIDGTLNIPKCFEEPSGVEYTLKPNSLPSEIDQC
uniref:Beta-2-glycoprotein 1 n=2 Tax=Poecilia mexicana TaxID=48701 RepID=A0A3B3XW68_9TELE